MNIDDRLNNIFDATKKIAVLAGAGVSLDSPSNLLDGWTFMEKTLIYACPPDIDPEIASNPENSWVLSRLKPPKRKYRRPGEQLRFEILMGLLAQSGLDRELKVLDCLGQCRHPNENHFILAELIKNGHLIITTNFDTLIEQAYELLSPSDQPPLRIVYDDGDFQPDKITDGIPTLWKIHGTLDLKESGSRNTMQATFTSILSKTMTRNKRNFLAGALRNYDLLTIGYSGWDDLDIIPVIADTPSSYRLIWVNHDRDEAAPPTLKTAFDLTEETTGGWESDSVGQDRIRYYTDPRGVVIRQPENILFLSIFTKTLMNRLREVYGGKESFPVVEGEYLFGRNHPAETDKFFSEWRNNFPPEKSLPYDFINKLFSYSHYPDARIDLCSSKLKKIRASAAASPAEKLAHYIETFNSIPPNDRIGKISDLRERVHELLNHLPEENLGAAKRLQACIVWELDGEEKGEDCFRRIVEQARQNNRLLDEFSSLQTWRSFAGYSQWSGVFPETLSDRVKARVSPEYLAEKRRESRLFTSSFPEEEELRLHQLADEIGFLPVVWTDLMRSLTDVIDDEPEMVLVNHDRVSAARRYAVDVGDVDGEALSSYIMARLYMLDQSYQLAIEEFLRVLELARIVDISRYKNDTIQFMQWCCAQLGYDYANYILPRLQRSMWNRRKIRPRPFF